MSRTAGEIVVATTWDESDDELAEVCRAAGHAVTRGHPTDLVNRHLEAAAAHDADVVVKIPSDCPLVDPAVIDQVISEFLTHPADYVSNLHPMTWPDGQDVEVMPIAVLETVDREATRPFEREHTTPFVWERPERFTMRNVTWERDLSHTHRWTLDYPEDLALVDAVLTALGPEASVEEIVAFLDRNPTVAALNAAYRGVNWYRHHLDELTTVDATHTRAAPGEGR
jgi:spore coat polysaccharide biosynthesis protein SpsF